jgi:glycine cleavage system transcriptional repressor
MPLLAVTVLGHDRPGIIADVTGALAELGGNLEDSSMTLLRGHFAMTLVVAGDAGSAEVQSRLEPLLHDLTVYVRPLPDVGDLPDGGSPYVLTVHGADRAGIVSSITRVVASYGGNITDLTTRLAGGLYVLVAEVDLPENTDVDTLSRVLVEVAHELGVGVSVRPAETDVL